MLDLEPVPVGLVEAVLVLEEGYDVGLLNNGFQQLLERLDLIHRLDELIRQIIDGLLECGELLEASREGMLKLTARRLIGATELGLSLVQWFSGCLSGPRF